VKRLTLLLKIVMSVAVLCVLLLGVIFIIFFIPVPKNLYDEVFLFMGIPIVTTIVFTMASFKNTKKAKQGN
jgi:hypothetical protein